MNFDPSNLRLGICDNCKFKGILIRVPDRPDTRGYLQQGTPQLNPFRVLDNCVGCYEAMTAGVISPNMTHKGEM